jgi:hypothetical protein
VIQLTRSWQLWLLLVFVSGAALEVYAIVEAHAAGDQNVFDWTLSDTIRRWAAGYRWLMPAALGTMAFLFAHLFLEKN